MVRISEYMSIYKYIVKEFASLKIKLHTFTRVIVWRKNTDLKVQNNFACQCAHEPGLRDIPHHGRRQAD